MIALHSHVWKNPIVGSAKLFLTDASCGYKVVAKSRIVIAPYLPSGYIVRPLRLRAQLTYSKHDDAPHARKRDLCIFAPAIVMREPYVTSASAALMGQGLAKGHSHPTLRCGGSTERRAGRPWTGPVCDDGSRQAAGRRSCPCKPIASCKVCFERAHQSRWTRMFEV